MKTSKKKLKAEIEKKDVHIKSLEDKLWYYKYELYKLKNLSIGFAYNKKGLKKDE